MSRCFLTIILANLVFLNFCYGTDKESVAMISLIAIVSIASLIGLYIDYKEWKRKKLLRECAMELIKEMDKGVIIIEKEEKNED